MANTATPTLSKVVRVGTLPGEGSIFCKIELSADGRLSISGVVGPTRGGNARGSCGQIIMGFKEYNKRGYNELPDITPAPDWTPELIRQFFDAWDRWHLNDMRAGCEHQRELPEFDASREVEVVSYKLTGAALQLRRAARKEAERAAAAGEVADLSETARALIACDWFKSTHSPPDADSPLSGCYEVEKRETKTAGWVRPAEHPDGILCKPCPVCGYKYGSAWKREEVPAEVLEFLANLPDTDCAPAWV